MHTFGMRAFLGTMVDPVKYAQHIEIGALAGPETVPVAVRRAYGIPDLISLVRAVA